MTNEEPKTRPIKNDRQINSLFPTRFLKPAQLLAWKVTEIIVTISRIVEEEVQPKLNQIEWKAVLYFMSKNGSEHPQGYLLSAKVDAESLTTSTGAQSVGDIPGKQIKIKLDTFRHKSVLRIDPEPIPPPAIEGEPDPEPETASEPSEPSESQPTPALESRRKQIDKLNNQQPSEPEPPPFPEDNEPYTREEHIQ